MRVIYEAENLLDGHLVKGLIEQRGITAFVSGQYLTGALGELPVAGLVNVMVADDDAEVAGEVVATLVADRLAFDATAACGDEASADDDAESKARHGEEG